ncbi:hypothetical protein ACFQ3W_25070 [Paenibacillus puldeungensis]|uniref:Uncharacterized protein n=1 Tax=Paenibacillus puldeungensis TaxID=696536 RepID=A0ABW3S426_9BACL
MRARTFRDAGRRPFLVCNRFGSLAELTGWEDEDADRASLFIGGYK